MTDPGIIGFLVDVLLAGFLAVFCTWNFLDHQEFEQRQSDLQKQTRRLTSWSYDGDDRLDALADHLGLSVQSGPEWQVVKKEKKEQ